MSDRQPPRLPDPSSSARITASGRQDRGRPIFREGAGSTEDFTFWEVEVTPLVATSTTGRDVNPAHGLATPAQLRDRVVFEVRAVSYGTGPVIHTGNEVLGGKPNTRLVRETHTEDVELARAIAAACVEVLRTGGRDVDLVAIVKDVEARRRG